MAGIQSTSLATAARYEEDTPFTAGDKGALLIAVRNDAGGTLVDANGDRSPLQVNNLGELIIGGPGGVFTVVVVQPVHDLLNCNANIQVGDVDVGNANPVPVSDAGGTLTVDQATHDNLNANANLQVGDVDVANANPVPVSDAAGSLTVDNPILSVVGGGAEATAQRVTMANDSTGLLSVDDNGGSLTVDQATHDNLNCNANVQIGDVDVGSANPVPVVGLVTDAYDYIDLGYDVNNNLTSAVYKTGGAGGATVAILALTYDGSGNLDTVTKT